MARYLTLNLVNEQGTPHPWPGTPVAFEIGTQQAADAVWIGVSEDGATNQVYPIDTPIATVLGAWPHVYQGLKLNLLSSTDDSPAQVGAGEYVYNNSLDDFNRMVAACCVAEQVPGSPSPGVCMVTLNYDIQIGGTDTAIISQQGNDLLNTSESGTGQVQVIAGVPVIFSINTPSGLVETNTVVSTDPTFADPEQELCNDSAVGGEASCEVTLQCGVEYFVLGTAFPTP